MLDEKQIAYRYREYFEEPLSADELRATLLKLGMTASDILRKRDKAVAANQLTGDEPDEVLIPLMAENPGMIQRPIGVKGKKAVVGRPVENLLKL